MDLCHRFEIQWPGAKEMVDATATIADRGATLIATALEGDYGGMDDGATTTLVGPRRRQ